MQGPAIRIAKQKGYRVVLADGNPDAVEIPHADEFFHVDLKDMEGLTRVAKTIPGLAGVFTAGTDFSASVAWVASRLELPGIPYEAALNASDKARMRTVLRDAGVPIPAFVYGDKNDDPIALSTQILSQRRIKTSPLFPLVVKPVDNMGARGCRMARNPAELALAWADAIVFSKTGRVIIEDYIDGPEFSIDSLMHDGKMVVRGIADRHVFFEPFFVEMGHTMPSAYNDEVLAEVLAVFKRGVRALGITLGAAKGDMKYGREGAQVGEIAARLSGGYMSGWTYPYSSGIEVTAEAIDLACGVVPEFATSSIDHVCVERACISIPGVVREIANLNDAKAIPGVREIFLRVKPGDTVKFPSNNVEKCGNFIAADANRLAAEAAAGQSARSLLIRLRANHPETAAFLARTGTTANPLCESWPPDAYPDIPSLLLGIVSAMPDIMRLEKPVRTVSIAPLQGIFSLSDTDWQGRTLKESVDGLCSLTGASVGIEGDIVLGRVFWQALFRGGYQGAAYVVDTLLAEHA